MQSGAGKRVQKQSILYALVGLMIAFELLGRGLGYEVRDAFSQMLDGSGSGKAVLDALGASFASPDFAFLNARNLTNLTTQVAVNGILAVGMTLIILTGGIDLSVGSVVALSGIVLGLCDVRFGMPGLAVGAAVLTGLLAGGVNGLFVARLRIPPFVISLGTLVIARGLALIFSNSSAIAPLSEPIRFIGGGFVGATVVGVAYTAGIVAVPLQARRHGTGTGEALRSFLDPQVVLYSILGAGAIYVFNVDRGVPVPALLLGVLAACGIFLTQRTVFGRSLYAIGGNESAAVLSGLNVPSVKLRTYAIMGALAGVCGVILAGRLNSATPTEGNLLELDAIASVVIGGTSLQGGVGRIQGSIIGAFIIGVLNNGMDMLEISSNWQMVTKGLIIVFAVYTDARMRKAA
jgi:D-xylose transport system permease protein